MHSHKFFSVINKKEYQKKYHRSLRIEVLEAYGGKCVCCGEAQKSFLSLDHIHNDGATHRREVNGTNSGCSNTIWNLLKRQGWPKDRYRLLCYNCNVGRHRNFENPGICPHEIERGKIESVRVLLDSIPNLNQLDLWSK